MWPNPQETIKDFFIFCAVSLRDPDTKYSHTKR